MADRNSLVASRRGRDLRQIATGLAFLSPNILGFLAFTAIPLVFSLVMAFTDWNLQLHNQFKQSIDPVPVKFVGLDNFKRLLFEPGAEITWRFWEHLNPQFWKYLGNTLYLMIGLPFAIGGSLLAASMLSRDLKGGSRSNWAILLAGAVLVASILFLLLLDAGAMGNTLLIVGLLGAILVVGVAGGTTVYRTLFYLPYFTAGVATFLLWKKIFSPSGPLTLWVNKPLAHLSGFITTLPPAMVHGVAAIMVLLTILAFHFGLHRLYLQREDGDLKVRHAIVPLLLMLSAPMIAVQRGWILHATALILWIGIGLVLARHLLLVIQHKPYIPTRVSSGSGGALMLACAIMTGMFILLGLAALLHKLPALAAEGLHSPEWLTDPHWAKPSLILMGLWAAIGSNSMLMYLAALTNVPQELYEAADIDGAKPFTKFWNVTWPQLAPTTFFLVVMGMIGGLQGGFEMARVMTNGGPAGQTTTLAYYIYTEGFETGRLGYASAVSWTLFLLVLVVTLFNWKFGNRYVND